MLRKVWLRGFGISEIETGGHASGSGPRSSIRGRSDGWKSRVRKVVGSSCKIRATRFAQFLKVGPHVQCWSCEKSTELAVQQAFFEPTRSGAMCKCTSLSLPFRVMQ